MRLLSLPLLHRIEPRVVETYPAKDDSPSCAPGGSKASPMRSRALALCVVFMVSGFAHEAVTFVAVCHTCWPFNTYCLLGSALVILAWDTIFPPLSTV